MATSGSANARRSLLGEPVNGAASTKHFAERVALLSGGCDGSPGVTIGTSGERGRGVFATRNFAAGERVLSEAPLVGAQHETNKRHARTCACCFRFVGSVEREIGRRLLDKLDDDGEVATSSGSLPGGLTIGDVVKLACGEAKLPGSENFAGPDPVACVGQCSAHVYCSERCRDDDWNMHERMLCLGERGTARNKQALEEFYAHASETNDIFIVAAKVVANMCVRAMEAKRTHDATQSSGKSVVDEDEERVMQKVYDYARLPYAVVHNAPWWECVATPDDCEDDEVAETDFRNTLYTLANDSLDLLRHAWNDVAETYPRIFEIETYGRIIGAFELNNLELVVESPTENYFLAVDAMPHGDEKNAVTRLTQPLLDALDVDYDVPCIGTALFSIQSGFNHDCEPNAAPLKDESDKTGACVIVARRPIAAGEEITISYLADSSNQTRDARQDALADYGFTCRCERCEREFLESRRRK